MKGSIGPRLMALASWSVVMSLGPCMTRPLRRSGQVADPLHAASVVRLTNAAPAGERAQVITPTVLKNGLIGKKVTIEKLVAFERTLKDEPMSVNKRGTDFIADYRNAIFKVAQQLSVAAD